MKVFKAETTGFAPLLDAVAETGAVTGVTGEYVTYELNGTRYTFHVTAPLFSTAPLVLLVSVEKQEPGAVVEAVTDGEGRAYEVRQRTAALVATAHAQFERCERCVDDAHEHCLSRRSTVTCRCECAEAWVVTDHLPLATALVAAAPAVHPAEDWGLPCLCACQDDPTSTQMCQCDHRGCANPERS